MATRFDIENLREEIETILKAKLNTKITALNSEKGDTLLLSVDSTAYYFQSVNSENISKDPYIFTGVASVDASTTQGAVAGTITYDIYIVFSESSNDDLVGKRIFRYQRAIKEVVTENFSEIDNVSTIEVSDLNPIALEIAGSDEMHHATGVQIRTAIA